jgi:uncharacterized protein (DUF1697 family)
MPRFVAFLRGVSPLNAKSADLVRAFEKAGFSKVKTVLSSGNVVFDSARSSESEIVRSIEAALSECCGRSFRTMVRTSASLQKLLKTDPYSGHKVPAAAKRIVSFLPKARPSRVKLPLALDGAQVLHQMGREVFTVYVRSEKGPVFMQLIEKAFGDEVTTRTWDTVRKCSVA